MTLSQELLVRAAARNNAEWCAAVSRSHGLAGEFAVESWAAPARTPVYYPDAVTLVPGVDAAALVARIDTAAPGASVKDSFADADLAGFGFRVLFEAQWIHRLPGAPTVASELEWSQVRTPDALRAWALAWDGGEGQAELFRPDLLEDPSVVVLSGFSADGRVVAGAVVNRSGELVGVSNVFSIDGGADTAWPPVLAAVDRLFPSLPVVGYEHGDDLAAAVRHGFAPIGPLRVWLHG